MKVLFFYLLSLTACCSIAQFNDQKADSIYNLHFKNGEFMGNVLVAKSNKIIYSRSFGYTNIKDSVELFNTSVFYLASLTKPITASAVFLLEQRGVLNTSDLVSTHIPEFPAYRITINQLLSHTSGLGDMNEFVKTYADTTIKNTNKDILNAFVSHKPKLITEPGTKWFYSDLNYALLALLIERVSHKSYEDFIQTNFLNKVNSTLKIGEANLNYKIKHLTESYILQENGSLVTAQVSNKYNYTSYLGGIYGDGGFYGSILDYFKWTQAIQDTAIIKKSTLKKMLSPATFKNGKPVKTSWGSQVAYGWDTDINSKLGMNGNKGAQYLGYMGVVFTFPEEELTMIVLSTIETDSFWGIGS